ncbi:ImcF-related family protein [Serratia aquatilis]|uniref:ImcF-related family protein n=1 Tax=Serratia aquatilis TaxID=1737515 RepID=A0ABV6EI62_9GAMM
MSQEKGSRSPRYGFWGYFLLTVGLAGVSALLLFINQDKLESRGIPVSHVWSIWGGIFSALLFGLVGMSFWWRWRQKNKQREFGPPQSNKQIPVVQVKNSHFVDLKHHLRTHYGFFWQRRVTTLLLIGQPDQVERLAPGLTSQHWLEGEGTVLLWGGDATAEPDNALLRSLRKLRRCPLDGILWVTQHFYLPVALGNPAPSSELYGDTLDTLAHRLTEHYRALGWQIPLFVWALQDSPWDQHARIRQSVGCLLPPACQPDELVNRLEALLPTLTERGTQQVLADPRHDFLLALAHSLRGGGIERLKNTLSVLMRRYQALPLAGIFFSLPLTASARSVPHRWGQDKSWDALLASVSALPSGLMPKRLGLPWLPALRAALCVVLLLWGAGMLVSFFANRALIKDSVQQSRQALDTPLPLAERLRAQYALQQTLATLQYRAVAGSPWYTRLGLNQNAPLLQALWPIYQHSNQLLVRDAVARHLQQQLVALVAMPPESAQRRQQGKRAYDQLKAYLMMARPQKTDPAFLSQTLLADWQQRPGVDPGVWQALSPALIGFYAQNLAAHPEWKITADDTLVHDVRQILLRQFGVRNAEATLYQNMLRRVAKTYGDMTLNQMTGDTDASLLFSTDAVVAGIFTRKAWEESVAKAIDRVVNERREEIDWVLTDSTQPLAAEISPEALKARLTERYFTDFASRWLDFLNSIKWHRAGSLSDAIDQLTLMTDVRQSPLIALMNTLAWQGKTGQTGAALSDSLVKSAKNLFNRDPPGIDQNAGPKGPLDKSFGPILALMEGRAGGQDNTHLSLQTFLTRVTRVRLKLQQVTNATDPQAMTQSLAQTVFQGKAVDLTDTRDYGSLVAASLGQEWSRFAQAMFVQPMEQAWQQVLAPTAGSLNAQWKSTLVDDWNAAFAGRYPFKEVSTDASLSLMSQYLRADTGRIQRFLESHLNGILHKEGSKWVPDKVNAQGLTFNPAFLAAMNTLSHLADVVFTNGDAGLFFELRPGTAKDVMQTALRIDSQTLIYSNQMPVWTRFAWPNDTAAPGATLSWISTRAGTRLYADLPGTWGLIRLLDKARVKGYMGSTTVYDLTWKAQDGLPLHYLLRTELGEGPLSLLGLKGFVMPKQIFLSASALSDDSASETEFDE